jgi:hypothetical protein
MQRINKKFPQVSKAMMVPHLMPKKFHALAGTDPTNSVEKPKPQKNIHAYFCLNNCLFSDELSS